MNVLRFKKGCKKWDTTYEAELDFEYTASQEKKVTALILHIQDLGKRVNIPWDVFELYAEGATVTPYTDASNVKLMHSEGRLYISNGGNLNIVIHEDQIAAIKRAARNIVGDVSYSVENIFRQYSIKSI